MDLKSLLLELAKHWGEGDHDYKNAPFRLRLYGVEQFEGRGGRVVFELSADETTIDGIWFDEDEPTQ